MSQLTLYCYSEGTVVFSEDAETNCTDPGDPQASAPPLPLKDDGSRYTKA